MPEQMALPESNDSNSTKLNYLIEHILYIQSDVKLVSELAADRIDEAIAVLSFILLASNLPKKE